ncbi:MAG: hypothetical protein R6V54_09665 [Desulfobacteraceae bacterium]
MVKLNKTMSQDNKTEQKNRALQKRFQPVTIKELFTYNQIIVKLAQQLSMNKERQRPRVNGKENRETKKNLALLRTEFSAVLRKVTDDFVRGEQKNIDEILLKTGLITPGELEFIHQGAGHLKIKALDKKFGKIAVDHRYTSQNVINNALDEQTEIYRKTSQSRIIGNILVEQHQLSSHIRDDILLLQNRILEEDWEELLREAGTSSIKEREKNALFGTLVIKEKMLKKEQVIEALKIRNRESRAYKKRERTNAVSGPEIEPGQPRWIGDILVTDFGLSRENRTRIVKKQMAFRFEQINLKFGLNIGNVQQELFEQLEKVFHLFCSENDLAAHINVLREVPETLTRDNIILWLYHRRITHGRIDTAVNALLTGQVKPGQTILVAKGEAPVPHRLDYQLNFKTDEDPHSTLAAIVPKGARLAVMKLTEGSPGLSVKDRIVPPGVEDALPLVTGKNVLKNGASFTAGCDGLPRLSSRKVISLSSTVTVQGDMDPDFSFLDHDCDFDITGSIPASTELSCRSLTAGSLKGKVTASGDVSILKETIGATLTAKETIKLARVKNSTITGEKSIAIDNHLSKKRPPLTYGMEGSVVSCNDTCRIKSDMASSIVRAKRRIVFIKGQIGPHCRFIAGDSLEIIACKQKIELLSQQLTGLSQQKADPPPPDRLETIKREILRLKQQIIVLYKHTPDPPELDFRKVTVPKGTVLQFPNNRTEVESDLEGFLFRELYSRTNRRFEIKQHRW